MEEIWKTIEDYPNYMISNMGQIKSLNFNRTGKEQIMKIYTDNKTGYNYVILCKENKKKRMSIHRLVAQAFIPNPDNKPCIDHINANRTDNRVENLRWVTHRENQHNHLSILNHSKAVLGYKNPMSKTILQFTKDNEFIKKWNCIMDVERNLGLSNSNISSCCSGKLKTSGGYKWGYADDYERIPFKVFDLEIYKK